MDELSFNVNEVIEILMEGLYPGVKAEGGECSDIVRQLHIAA